MKIRMSAQIKKNTSELLRKEITVLFMHNPNFNYLQSFIINKNTNGCSITNTSNNYVYSIDYKNLHPIKNIEIIVLQDIETLYMFEIKEFMDKYSNR